MLMGYENASNRTRTCVPDEPGVLVFETSAVPIEPYWQETSMRFELMYTGFADRLLESLGYDAIIQTERFERSSNSLGNCYSIP